MGSALSISPRDRKVIIYNGDPMMAPTQAFANTGSGGGGNGYDHQHLSNLKNQRQPTIKENNGVGDGQYQVNYNHNNSSTKKSSTNLIISALNLGKHFSVSRKKEKEKSKKEKAAAKEAAAVAARAVAAAAIAESAAASATNAANSNLILMNDHHQDNYDNYSNKNNMNMSKSLSCYNLKSGTTTNNIEVVKNLSRKLEVASLNNQSANQPNSTTSVGTATDTLSNNGSITLTNTNTTTNPTNYGSDTVGPPLPPKPTILMSSSSIKPITESQPVNTTSIGSHRSAITLTSASLAPPLPPHQTSVAPLSLTASPSTTHRKTVIQVSG